MTPELVAALSTAIVAIIGAIGAALASWKQARKNAAAIQELHIIVNDRLTQLLKKTESSARAEGHIEGVAHSKAKARCSLANAEEKARAMLLEAEEKATAIREEAAAQAQALIDHAAALPKPTLGATGTSADPIHMTISAEPAAAAAVATADQPGAAGNTVGVVGSI